ncbi:MAG: hypothetical protein KAY04_06450, partial [Burkholderiales bacterium]|nr:hypothetical protein [Burkholderiales bacterium]
AQDDREGGRQIPVRQQRQSCRAACRQTGNAAGDKGGRRVKGKENRRAEKENRDCCNGACRDRSCAPECAEKACIID